MTSSTRVSWFGSLPFRVPAHRAGAESRPIPNAWLVALVDTALAVGLLGLVIIVTSVQEMPTSIEYLLSLRITLRNLLLLALFAAAWPMLFNLSGLYNATVIDLPAEEGRRVVIAVSLGTLIAVLLTALSRPGGLTTSELFFFWLTAVPGTLVIRALRRSCSGAGRRRRVLIIGSGSRAVRMWHALSKDHTASYEVTGFVDCAGSVPASDDIARKCIGTLDDLESMLMHHTVDDVCIALPVKSRYREIQEALLVCERVGVRTKYDADLFQTEVAWPRYEASGRPVVTMQVVPDDYRLLIKRIIDIAGAAVAIVVFAPLMLAAAVAIKLTSPGPVLFAQHRYGLNRRTFRMFKFRTMVVHAERMQAELEDRNEAEGPVFKISADPRITRLGRLLRRTSIDELPQLFNVLRGEMSLVGPRPLPLRDVDRFTCASDLRRFSVRPGLTCLWQISGRSNVGFREWVSLDLKYIDGWSLALDLVILARTIPVVLRGTGAQ